MTGPSTGTLIAHEPEVIGLTETTVLRDLDARLFCAGQPFAARPRFVWRGPASDPVFALQDSRELTFEHIDVVCETPCEAVFLIERTKRGAGVIPSTMHQFRDVRIFGNGLAAHGFWARATIDENNEHGRWDACSVYGASVGWCFEGQQSKEHLLTHCRFETGTSAVVAASGFQWVGGICAQADVGVALTRVGEPVVIQGVGFESTHRLLHGAGASTATQPVTIIGCRFEADQLADDGDAIVITHAGPLTVQGCRLGGGQQRVPRIALLGIGPQCANIVGNTFGTFGAAKTCPVRASNPSQANVAWGRNVFQRAQADPQNTESRTTWAAKLYL